MDQQRGQSCPVTVPDEINRRRDYSSMAVGQLMALTPQELAAVDPLAMNLIVARGIPALADLEIQRFQVIVDGWVADFSTRCLAKWEPYFYQSPEVWNNDIRFFRLGMVCQYLDLEVGINYNREQRGVKGIFYTNPSDLFLNGVIETREGTCGNMAALQHAIGWRLGWPVSLACANSHFFLRFDDGNLTYNMEATQAGNGGFKSDPDEYIIEKNGLPPIALQCGSDLRALRPHEVLGSFIGLRARHLQDVGRNENDESQLLMAEIDWLLARRLFPTNRRLYTNQLALTVLRGDTLFVPDEIGHPNSFVRCLQEIHYNRQNQWRMHTTNDEPDHDYVDSEAKQ